MKPMIAYASGAIIASVGVCTLYIFLWLEVTKGSLTREIKRLELQVALLTSASSERDQEHA